MSDLHYIPGVDPPYKILTEKKLKEFVTSKDIPITSKTGGTGYCPTYSEVEDYLGDKRTYRLFFKKEPKYKDNELIWEVDFTTGLKKRTVEWTPHPGSGPTVPSSGGQSCAQVSLDKTVKLDGVVYAEESKTFGPETVCHTFPPNNSRTSPSASECYTFVDSEEDHSEQVCANFSQEAAPEYALHWEFNGGTPVGSYTPDGSTLLEGEPITYPTDITRGQDTFLGWTPAPPLSMPASSLTITANWEVFVPDESITWIPVHGELSGDYTTSGKPGDPLILPTHPTIGDVVDGYTCTGWDPTPGSTIPSGGATYTALWTDPVIPEPEDELESITSASGNKLTYGKIPAAGTAIPYSELVLNFVLHYSISGNITKSYSELGLTPTFEASEILTGTGGAISSSNGNASANANTGDERDVCKSTASVSGTYQGISVNGSVTSAMIKQAGVNAPVITYKYTIDGPTTSSVNVRGTVPQLVQDNCTISGGTITWTDVSNKSSKSEAESALLLLLTPISVSAKLGYTLNKQPSRSTDVISKQVTWSNTPDSNNVYHGIFTPNFYDWTGVIVKKPPFIETPEFEITLLPGIYAWAEIHEKNEFKLSNYKYYSSGHFTKYTDLNSVATQDKKVTLESSDDVATSQLGDGWRTPGALELEYIFSKFTLSTVTDATVDDVDWTHEDGSKPTSTELLGVTKFTLKSDSNTYLNIPRLKHTCIENNNTRSLVAQIMSRDRKSSITENNTILSQHCLSAIIGSTYADDPVGLYERTRGNIVLGVKNKNHGLTTNYNIAWKVMPSKFVNLLIPLYATVSGGASSWTGSREPNISDFTADQMPSTGGEVFAWYREVIGKNVTFYAVFK